MESKNSWKKPIKEEQAKRELIHIFWTGGWDSTYRVIELSMRDVIVQPIYVLDPKRLSVKEELQAMEKIISLLRKKEETKAELRKVRIISVGEIPIVPDITAAYQVFKNETEMGYQHDWLARLALQYPMIEMCIEKGLGDHTPVRQSVYKHGKLIDTGDGYIIDQEKSSKELCLILGKIRLPIFNTTEQEMYRNIKEWGYEDVMSNIWFCHHPIKGKPCGLCNPCTTKMTSGMEFLLPDKAQRRNRMMRRIKKISGGKGVKIYEFIVRKFDMGGGG